MHVSSRVFVRALNENFEVRFILLRTLENSAQKHSFDCSIARIGKQAPECMLGYSTDETCRSQSIGPFSSQISATRGHAVRCAANSQVLIACRSEAKADEDAACDILGWALNPNIFLRGNISLSDMDAPPVATREASTRSKQQQLDATTV